MLVVNAGVCNRRGSFTSGSAESAHSLVELNVLSAVALTRLLVPQMVQALLTNEILAPPDRLYL